MISSPATIPHHNLAVNYLFIGRYQEALTEALEAARPDPNNVSAADNAIDAFVKLKRIDEAKQKLEELRKRNPDAPSVHRNSCAFAALARTPLRPPLPFCNAPAQNQPLIDESSKLYPKDTGVSVIGLPIIRALLEINRGNPATAVQLLESLRPYDLGALNGQWSSYVRGLAYLQERKGTEAAAEFQRILEHPEIDATSQLNSLAHLGLARAAAMKGDIAQSRKSYQDCLALWRDADPNVPILIEVKKEYEQLK